VGSELPLRITADPPLPAETEVSLNRLVVPRKAPKLEPLEVALLVTVIVEADELLEPEEEPEPPPPPNDPPRPRPPRLPRI
jgi:hypothetical protein